MFVCCVAGPSNEAPVNSQPFFILLVIIATSLSILVLTVCFITTVLLCRHKQIFKSPANVDDVKSSTQCHNNMTSSATVICTDRSLARIHRSLRKKYFDRSSMSNRPIIFIGHNDDTEDDASVCVIEPLMTS